MTNHHAQICRDICEQLSEWLDDQAAEPARINAHLRECGHCARLAEELRTVSTALKNMSAPPVDEDFAAQVAARIRGAARARRSYRRAAAGILAFAASLAIVAAALMSQRQHVPDQFGLDGSDIFYELQNGDAWIVAEILQGADPELWDYGFPVPPALIESGDEALVLSLAESAWFLQAAEAWEAQIDLDELLLALDEMEKMEFKRLLNMYKETIEI